MQAEAKESAVPDALPDLSQEDAVVYEALSYRVMIWLGAATAGGFSEVSWR